MMIEIFKYTERVINMIRPRKLLFMAIGKSRIDESNDMFDNKNKMALPLAPK